MKRIRLLLFGVLILGVVGLLMNSRGLFQPDKQVDVVEQISEQVSLVIDFGEMPDKQKQAEVTLGLAEGETAFSVLQKVVEAKSFQMETKQYDFGVFVQSIDGYESGSERAWIYFVNGESGNVAADQYKLKSGDRVEWKYIEPNF